MNCHLKGQTIHKVKKLLEKRTYQQVADILHCSRQAVFSFVVYHGVFKPRGFRPPTHKKQPYYNYDIIANLLRKKVSYSKICKVIGCSRGTIRFVSKEYGLQYQPATTIILKNKKWLYDHYITKRMSLARIATMIHSSSPSVARHLKMFKIKIRLRGRYHN